MSYHEVSCVVCGAHLCEDEDGTKTPSYCGPACATKDHQKHVDREDETSDECPECAQVMNWAVKRLALRLLQERVGGIDVTHITHAEALILDKLTQEGLAEWSTDEEIRITDKGRSWGALGER